MTKTELTADEVRLALGEKKNPLGRRTFSKRGKALAVAYARNKMERGASAVSVARELGVPEGAFHRWGGLKKKKVVEQFISLRVREETRQSMVLRGAHGVSIEGLTSDEAAQILARLACLD
jgi:transposase-like protein